MTTAKVIADSLNKETGDRLTTMELVYPRVVHGEFMTHRCFSRNAASSRAKPVRTVINEVKANPYIPSMFGLKQSGMQPKTFVSEGEPAYLLYRQWWLESMDHALVQAEKGIELGLHKQVVNRLLEPFQYITVICTGTDWDNFFKLRTEVNHHGYPMADVPIYELALAAKEAMLESNPNLMNYGDWHMPYTGGQDWDKLSGNERLQVSIARCARVSYKTWDGTTDPVKDLNLYSKLSKDQHLSPLEHVATCVEAGRYANLSGFASYRYFYEQGRIK